ncbi:hypothetical protein HU200_036018 [Digitaria exilis]|uniref:Uncharacterized protein n=1 Tax=Digitaria exilis TaxID=1010633 RepID=A0A835EKQ1_9POAL|nr:hypothetical protein HU200_036018 [Digitaria exilis]
MYWKVYDHESNKKIVDLGVAPGLDVSRRLAYVPLGAGKAGVGKWYCPFFLVEEHGVTRRDPMGRGAFYEVVLEQRWEPMHGDAVRHGDDSSKLAMKVLIGGSIEVRSEDALSSLQGATYMWFVAATGQKVGVCTMVCERMLWEVTKAGWVDEEKDAGRVAHESMVLVERFVVKRMDGSVVVAIDFVHLNVTKANKLV